MGANEYPNILANPANWVTAWKVGAIWRRMQAEGTAKRACEFRCCAVRKVRAVLVCRAT